MLVLLIVVGTSVSEWVKNLKKINAPFLLQSCFHLLTCFVSPQIITSDSSGIFFVCISSPRNRNCITFCRIRQKGGCWRTGWHVSLGVNRWGGIPSQWGQDTCAALDVNSQVFTPHAFIYFRFHRCFRYTQQFGGAQVQSLWEEEAQQKIQFLYGELLHKLQIYLQ